MYRAIVSGGEIVCIEQTETGLFIPLDPGNRHYQEYVAYLALNPENTVYTYLDESSYDVTGNVLEA